MHLSDGVLPVGTVVAGYVVAGAGLAASLRSLKSDDMPRVAVMSASFFVASLIHVRLGAAVSVHLLLHGLVGIILGVQALPAIAVGLILQALQFGHGGILTWGVNTCIMGLPAVALGLMYRKVSCGHTAFWKASIGGVTAGGAVLVSAILAALALMTAGESFHQVAWALVVAHIPIIFIEGVVTAFVVSFLLKVKPEMLQ